MIYKGYSIYSSKTSKKMRILESLYLSCVCINISGN